jgi:hypothetical protein
MKSRSVWFFVLVILFFGWASAEVLFEDSFDSHPDWTTNQPVYPSNVGNALCDGANDGSTACSDCPQGDAKYWGRYIGTSAWSGYKGEETVQISSSNARGGSGKAATFWMEPIDTARCDSGSMWCSDGQMAVRLPEAQDTIFIRYYIKFQPDWVWDTTSGHSSPSGKIVHAAYNHDIDGSGCFQAFSNGQMFPAIVQNIGNEYPFYQSDAFNLRATVRFQSSYYGNYGDPVPDYLVNGDFARAWIPGGSGTAGYNGHKTWEESMGDGEWHSVEIELTGNSAMGAEDGVFRIWYDGEEILDLDRVAYADNQYWDECNNCLNPPRDFVGWNMVSIGGNFYNRAYPEDTHIEQWYAIDDFVVSTEYIGPDYVIGEGSSCVSSLINSSWSVWGNVSSCRANDTVLQERSLTQSDLGGCVGDVLFSESQETGCVYDEPVVVEGILFEDNFDSHEDWTVAQPSVSSVNCVFGDCGISGDWDHYRNGMCQCDDSLSGEPGNNLMYIDSGAGYPNENHACYSGEKCFTFWQESCISHFDDSDGNLGVDLEGEYEDVYLKFHVRFKDGFERKALVDESGFMMKMFHIQHYNPLASVNPWSYHEREESNQPVTAGGLYQYSDLIHFYATVRCQENYECNGNVLWNLDNLEGAYNDGGLFDGGWHSIEIKAHRNSAIGVSDAALELWVDGIKKDYLGGYEGDSLEMNDLGSTELRGWRYVSIGGNAFNQWDTSCGEMGDCEQWYAMDDVVISSEYVGPDYVIGSGSETPVVCVHDADLEPCDGSVSTGELVAYLGLWESGGKSIGQVMGAVVEWVG